MRVGERPPAGDDFLQQVDGAVVVLELEALARLGHEVLRTDVHGPPRTIVRSAGSPPRCRPWAGSRARVPRVAGRRPKRELRSEEHTSELQSRRDLVCRLLLEKKKKK